ncbi:MAG TPA: T9SS type A sorting domain-containing protein [Chitinophagales bacterium]|nr:T9SS type A sorting domain-containing protein [Chitinophagales bacterium]
MCTKKLLLTLTSIVFFLSTNAQQYHPLIRENTYWDVFHGDASEICDYSGADRYFFEGDTSFSGVHYKIIRSYKIINVNPGPFCYPYEVEPTSTYVSSFLREDTLAKKVFIYCCGSYPFGHEELLYDFSLSVGDTLDSPYPGMGLTLVIDSIGTVTLLDGSQRKIFYPTNNQFFDYLYYIEGIGGSGGLFFPLPEGIGFWESPTCITENGNLLWLNEIWNYCVPVAGIENNDDNPQFSISPIPFHNEISFQSDVVISEVKIYDIVGRAVFEKYYSSEIQSCYINVSGLSDGVYFMEATCKDGTIIKKLVKE